MAETSRSVIYVLYAAVTTETTHSDFTEHIFAVHIFCARDLRRPSSVLPGYWRCLSRRSCYVRPPLEPCNNTIESMYVSSIRIFALRRGGSCLLKFYSLRSIIVDLILLIYSVPSIQQTYLHLRDYKLPQPKCDYRLSFAIENLKGSNIYI